MATKRIQTSGGKGNLGRFIERDSKICAAGKPTDQPKQNVKELLTQYSLQDEVNALISDAIIPSPEVIKLPPLRYGQKRDMRHAGIFSEGHDLLNPPVKSKFQTLVEDFKNTTYESYWTKTVGKLPDQVPSLPEGFNIYSTRLGKENTYENLYRIIMPVEPITDKTPDSQKVGYQLNRRYCSFDPTITFGNKSNADPSGKFMKCCLKDDKVFEGTALRKPILERQVKHQNAVIPKLGVALTPNENIKYVPEGHTFGIRSSPDNVSECLRTCKMNPYKDQIKKCLGHLNTLRQYLAKRFDRNFYCNFYSRLKFLDESKSGWLQKQLVYEQCNVKFIRFDKSLIEPLLSMWHAFDGSQIEYKTFIRLINYNESLDIPKIRDLECNIEYRTTYNESFKDSVRFTTIAPMAGVRSGRYFDKEYPITPSGCCKADRVYLPEESDAKACLNPSLFTVLGVSHRDMYAKRDPKIVRKVFENAGESFVDDEFETMWKLAKKYHSQGWVCFETFRRAIAEYKTMNKSEK